MGRRIFSEKSFDLTGRVLSAADFVPFLDMGGFSVNPEQYDAIIKRAEAALACEIPQLIASDYMMYVRNGNRSIYQGKYYARRDRMLDLALGEYVERKGRFTDKLVDVVWLILEETSWVIPAHNQSKPGVKCCLPYAYTGEVDYIDLFSAATAADLAIVYYLAHDVLDDVTTLICERMLYELDRRIVKPYLSDEYMLRGKNWWTGETGRKINNWNPWIVSNILTVAALTVDDLPTRVKIIERSLAFLDNFTEIYHPEGGCDEGPSYWGAAGGALFDALTVLYDMTGGYVDVYADPLIKNMGEYITKVVVSRTRVLNFADSPARLTPSAPLVYQWGRAVGSTPMISYAADRMAGALPSAAIAGYHPYRCLRFISEKRIAPDVFRPVEKCYIGGVDIAISREPDGLYLAFKGGNNDESHNHNDLGNVIVFSGDTPVFIDAGSGTYTKKTFSPYRYDIWAMCSDHHNCATLGGFTQPTGAHAYAECLSYDGESGAMTLDLKNAYPTEAKIAKYTRSAVLENSVVKIVDDIEFLDTGAVKLHFLTVCDPENLRPGCFEIAGRTVRFDPELSVSVERLDASEPETVELPERWDTDAIRRITLTSSAPVKAKTYTLTVE